MKLFYHPRFEIPFQTPFHPESPQRLKAIVEKLKAEGLYDQVIVPEERPELIPEELGLIHDLDYINYVKAAPKGYLDPNTYKREGEETYYVGGLASHTGILAVTRAYKGEEKNMALLRPPGHHSGRDYSGGFCYFNNIAVGAEHAIRNLGAERIAIVDIDVHHGNGTWDLFRTRDDVLYISAHQWGIYPGTGPHNSVGEEKGKGYTVNIPFPAGTGDSSYLAAYDKIIYPILRDYKPDMILISLGTDGHYRDPLATLNLSSHGYLSLMKSILGRADELCKGRAAAFLEGGYDLEALAEVTAGIVADSLGTNMDMKHIEVRDEHETGGEAIDKTKEVLSQYWHL